MEGVCTKSYVLILLEEEDEEDDTIRIPLPWTLNFQSPKMRGKKRAAPAFLSLLEDDI